MPDAGPSLLRPAVPPPSSGAGPGDREVGARGPGVRRFSRFFNVPGDPLQAPGTGRVPRGASRVGTALREAWVGARGEASPSRSGVAGSSPRPPTAPGASPFPERNPSGAWGAAGRVWVSVASPLRDVIPFLCAWFAERCSLPSSTSLPGWVTARRRNRGRALACRGVGGHLLGSGFFVDLRPGARTHLPVRMEGTVPPGCSSPGVPGQC